MHSKRDEKYVTLKSKICNIKEETLDSRQVRFFVINVLFSL